MRRISALLLFTMLAGLLAACTDGGGTNADGTPQPPANALQISIAYSPEKEGWLKDRIAAFNATRTKSGERVVFVEGVNKSSGAARTEIKNGALKVTVWSPSASTWLEVLKYETSNPNVAVSNESLVLTPVVISMWKPMAEALGWPNKAIGWSDMLKLINDPQGWGSYGRPEWGRFSWGHTDPEISTSALSTLLAEFYAAVGKQRDLKVADVQDPKSQQFIRDLGKGIKHYGYNTLVFSENMQKFGMSYISAFPMEEITLIDFNKNKNPSVPLVAIYPREGTFWHDNPYIVMSSATAEEQAAAKLFYDYLLTEESQKLAMSYGFRPANINVPLADPISLTFGVQPQGVQSILPVPPAEVIVAAKDTWAQNRKRADIVLVVDISGSMNDDNKIEQAKAGLETFLARILPEDRVGLVVFASGAQTLIEPAPLKENRIALSDAIQSLRAEGKTAIFDGLLEGKRALESIPADGEERIKAIVLLSDGQDTASTIGFEQLRTEFEESSISIFPVAYGADADESELQRIVDFSRTILVKGSSGDIGQIFDNLSRYF
jgi:Ca-activated chloride channel family protein